MDRDYKKISRLFSEYELLFEKDPNSALKKMIDLLPLADEIYNHEVTDAIDIWINENINQEIVEYLKNKINRNNNLNKKYNNWILLKK